MFSAALLTAALASPGAPLAVIRNAPDFTLTDQDGKVVRLADLRGKVLVVGFVFTTCTGTCPATTVKMQQVHAELKRQGLLKGDRVRFLSITLDPARDSPEVLKKYARNFGIDTGSWSFLSGPPADVTRACTDWGMWVKALPGGQLDHPSRIFLVDGRGRVREVYSLEFFKPAWVREDVQGLLGEEK